MLHNSLPLFFLSLPPVQRLLGLDMGGKKIGVALSDVLRMIATPHSTIMRKSFAKDIGAIRALVNEHQIAGIVLGLPLEMNGGEGASCQMVREFAAKLDKALALPMVLQDERMSTAAVTRTLNETGLTRQKKAALDDKMAAAYILQGVLDQMRYQQGNIL